MPYPVRRLAHLPLEARDGTELSAAVWLPDAPGEGPFPAIVDAVPYRKDDDFHGLDGDTYGPVAAEGFACVRLDLRGSGSSAGVLRDEYLALEQDDLEDTLRALAAQDWCTGRIGVTGVSWGGFAAVQVAMRRPPELGAIAPIHWSHDRYGTDVHYVGGTLHCAELVTWPGEMVAEMALPPVGRLVGAEAFEQRWQERLEETPAWPFEWLRHQRRDAYWRHGSLCEDWEAVEVPVLAIGGWLDGYRDACLELLTHGRMPRRAVIGPWGHARPHRPWPEPGWDHRRELARWFGRWLRGDRNGVDEEPMLVSYLVDGQPREPHPQRVPGRWRAWRTWPPDRPTPLRLELAVDGTLVSTGPDGMLKWPKDRASASSESAGPTERRWRGPLSVGAGAPWWCSGHPPGAGSVDMRPDDAHSLLWETPPLEAPLDLLGTPVLRVAVSADQPVAQLAARLEEVHEDGYSALITRAVLNLTHRRSHADPEPLVPGRPEVVELPLMACGCTVPAGRRLRLALAGADWPNAWPPPRRTELTVHLGAGASAALELPLAAPADEVDAPPMPEAVHDADDGYTHHDPLTPTWSTERELMTGTTRIRLTGGWDTTLPDGGRTVGQERLLVEIADGDPTSCRAEQANVAESEHDGLLARAESLLVIACDEMSVSVDVELQVLRDGEPFWGRTWRERFPRDLL